MIQQLLETILRSNYFVSTGWTLEGTSGGGVSGSAAEIVSGGVTAGQLYVARPSGRRHILEFGAIELGVGTPTIATPLQVNMATTNMPSGNIGPVRKRVNMERDIRLSDFSGSFVEGRFEVNLPTLSNSVSFCGFGAPGWTSLLGMSGPGIGATLIACPLIGVMYNQGVNIANAGGVSLVVSRGIVRNTDIF